MRATLDERPTRDGSERDEPRENNWPAEPVSLTSLHLPITSSSKIDTSGLSIERPVTRLVRKMKPFVDRNPRQVLVGVYIPDPHT